MNVPYLSAAALSVAAFWIWEVRTQHLKSIKPATSKVNWDSKFVTLFSYTSIALLNLYSSE